MSQPAALTSPAKPRRGRPSLGEQAMSSAERKRRSRAQQKLAGLQSKDLQARIPTPFSCELDAISLSRLRKAARASQLSIAQMLEQLINEHLPSTETRDA